VIQYTGFYREVLESSSVAVVVVGADALVRHHTPAAAEMLTGVASSLVGELFSSLFSADAQGQVDSFLRRVASADASMRTILEARCTPFDGDERAIEMTAVNLAESPAVGGIAVSLVDRTEMHRLIDLAERHARCDALTGLLSRAALEEHGRTLFNDCDTRPALVALLDIDGLKPVNDTHGHETGDRVLRSVADRLSRAVGDSAMVARFGGERFAVLFSEVNAAEARKLLVHACRAIRMPLDGVDLRVTATCGVASSSMAQHWPGLINRADTALYEAKISKPGGVFFYRGDEPGWDERRKHEREALFAAEKTVVALKSDVVRLEHETRYDQRTGLLNAQAFEEDLAALHAQAAQQGVRYSLVLCDIDFFHNYNALYLYQPANITLRRVAGALTGACRPGDRVYRYGGEEMTILLPGTTLGDARGLAERLRRAVVELAIEHDNRPAPHIVTVSVGVAECDPGGGNSARALVDSANRALAVAKQSGRNRVETSGS
jgi:diguanylate cyclase (GGDEF)-like protein